MKKLRALWSGHLPLSEAFWTWVIAIGLPLNLATSVASLALISADQPWTALAAGYMVSVPYNVLVTVGVWRSAAIHEGDRQHAELARAVTAGLMLVLTVT